MEINSDIQNLKLISFWKPWWLWGPAILTISFWKHEPLLLHKCDAFPLSLLAQFPSPLIVLAPSQLFCVTIMLHCKTSTLLRLGAAFLKTSFHVWVWLRTDQKRNLYKSRKEEVKWIHCSWGPITARHRAGVLVGSSMLLISSATHLVHISNCWSCWPTAVQRVLLPRTWLRGHKLPQSGFSIDLSTNCPV